jgi:HK97 family phage major capsid protein
MRLKKIQEKRAGAVDEMVGLRSLVDKEDRTMTSEEHEKWDRCNDVVTQCDKDLDQENRLAEIQQRKATEFQPGREPTDTETPSEERIRALSAWARAGSKNVQLTEEDKQLMKRHGMSSRRGDDTVDLRMSSRPPRTVTEARAQSALNGGLGGYTCQDTMVQNLEAATLAYGGLRQEAQIIRTADGNDLKWPTFDDTSNEGEIVGENASVGTATDLSFGQAVWKAYKFSSKIFKVPTELLEDSSFNIDMLVGDAAGERIGRRQARAWISGTGANEPEGILVGGTLGKTAAAVDDFTGDEIIDLAHSVDPSYRDGGMAQFLLNDLILKQVRLLKDSEGRYLWVPGLRDGVTDLIYGYRYRIDQNMPSTMTTGTKVMAFGDLSKYKIRDVASVRFARLVERYVENDQVGYVMFWRADGGLLDAGTNPVKYMALA